MSWLIFDTEEAAETAQAVIWDIVRPPAEVRGGKPVPERVTVRWAVPVPVEGGWAVPLPSGFDLKHDLPSHTEVAEVSRPEEVHPLDRDGDGAPGGSLPADDRGLEDLWSRYRALTGLEPDRRWGEARLVAEIAAAQEVSDATK